ncbi:MAG TPA: outer membrane lipoprotein-sorting protein [Rikenellaceae bacterium]|nr:MAG: outer membrane lipoprotein-sorting protein [Bacteroidetes bacterium GWE2_40_15]HBZ24640.1 outer membrane lipoprotein-sorting protein [Rikenellaceae bacterium]
MNSKLKRYKIGLCHKVLTALLIGATTLYAAEASSQDGKSILRKIDENLSSRNQIAESSMTIHGRRSSRTITAKSWTEGDQKSFTEYLSPASEAGTKMLKLRGQLWIYTPAADRTIQISGHLLRQSVMGSDLSYEDMMDDRKLSDVYDVNITGRDTLDSRDVIILELTANVNDIAYYRQMMWVDSERYIPLKQEMYAKSGQLLKRAEMKNIKRVENRWYPSLVIYKDMLKEGKGTEFRTNTISFDQQIPEHIFSKASLR